MRGWVAILFIASVVAVGVYLGLTAVTDLLTDDSAGQEDRFRQGVVGTHTRLHLDRVGRPTVTGEVINGGNHPIANVSVTVTYYEGGEPIGRATGSTLFAPIPTEQNAPFTIRLNESVRPDRYEIRLEYDEYRGQRSDALVVEESHLASRSQDQIELVGEVRNAGTTRMDISVVATFYDANGSVIGARLVRPSPAQLGAGETGSFRIQYRTLGDVPSLAREYVDYELDAVRAGGRLENAAAGSDSRRRDARGRHSGAANRSGAVVGERGRASLTPRSGVRA